MKPAYELENFLDICAEGAAKVLVSKDAMITARMDFNLNIQERVLGFIAAEGLEHHYFINPKPWEKNPNAAMEILVDAYGFFSGCYIHGYIAFFFQPKTDKKLGRRAAEFFAHLISQRAGNPRLRFKGRITISPLENPHRIVSAAERPSLKL